MVNTNNDLSQNNKEPSETKTQTFQSETHYGMMYLWYLRTPPPPILPSLQPPQHSPLLTQEFADQEDEHLFLSGRQI